MGGRGFVSYALCHEEGGVRVSGGNRQQHVVKNALLPVDFWRSWWIFLKLGINIKPPHIVEECRLLGCDTMQFGRRSRMFWRNTLPPSSGFKSQASKKPAGSEHLNLTYQPWRWRQYIPTKQWWTTARLHGVTSRKITLVIVTTVGTSGPACILLLRDDAMWCWLAWCSEVLSHHLSEMAQIGGTPEFKAGILLLIKCRSIRFVALWGRNAHQRLVRWIF
jgi:hypothetical protein